MEGINRLFDILTRYREKFSFKQDALAGKENGTWTLYSIQDYVENANNISYAFLKLGIIKGDKIATITSNRPEWNFLDMGILQTGAIHVPIYPTISEADYKYILNHAEIKYVFVAGKELLRKIEHILPEVPTLRDIYTFQNIDSVKPLQELIDLGKQNPAPEKLEEAKNLIETSDPATLIYTSGTTGVPKGVLLSHSNIISNIDAVKDMFPLDEYCKGVSYLPVCHIYERTNHYVFQYLGTSIYYAENLGTIAENIREVQPQVLTTVPRLLEKVFDKIMMKGRALKGIKKGLFFWAVNLGKKYELEGKNIFYKLQLIIVNKLVFNKWRAALGGKLLIVVSGGAALQPRLARIYTAARIPVLEGYGLTETSPVIAVNTLLKGGRKFGTVGKPLKNVEVKIANDGEILCRAPSVMMGYYKEPEMTKQAIDEDKWFHTGDIGEITNGQFLKITGRKKEIFKTSFGKYISPQLIENKFKESSFIDTIVVLGENQKFAAALIVPDFYHLQSYCRIKRIKFSSNAEIVKDPLIKNRFQKEVDKYNAFFGSYEQIRKFELMGKEWSIESGEMTASLKLRRNYINIKYKDLIEQLYV